MMVMSGYKCQFSDLETQRGHGFRVEQEQYPGTQFINQLMSGNATITRK